MSNEWHEWKEVTNYVLTGRRLFRSSAPNYSGSDNTQKLTQTAVDFLTSKGINRIISFNAIPYTTEEKARLTAANITYLHLPVEDFTAATLSQLKSAIDFFQKSPNATTLVHCGFGHGRTGTGVTAIQLFSTKGKNPPEAEWESVNHVETDAQKTVLRQLRDGYLKGEL